MQGTSPGPTTDDEAVRQLAIEILERHEYARFRGWADIQLTWVEAVLRWLRELLEGLRGMSVEQPVTYWTIFAALFLLAALLLAHAVWSIRVALRTPEPTPRPRRPAGAPYAKEAQRLAEQDRFLEAAHALQLATIESLLERNVLRLSRFEPNRTLRQRLRKAGLPAAEMHRLLALVDRLERSWFRDRNEDPELYTAWRDLYEHLRTASPTERWGAPSRRAF